MKKSNNKITPSYISNFKSHSTTPASSVVINTIGISRRIVVEPTSNGFINAVIPNTKVMLVILEPIALPMAVFGEPLRDADTATIISGADEPIATIVRPMISGEIPRFRASPAAP